MLLVQFLKHFSGQIRKIYRLAPQCGACHLRQAQQVLNQCAHPVNTITDAPEHVLPVVVEARTVVFKQRIGEAVNIAQRCAQVMRDCRRKGIQFLNDA